MLGWPSRQRRGFSTKTPGFKSGRGQISLCLFSSQRGPWAQYLCTYIHIYARQIPRRPALKAQGSARRSLTTRGSSTDNSTRKAVEPSTRRALQADQSSYQSHNMRSNHRPGSPKVPNLYSRQHPNGRKNHTRSLQTGLGAIISPLFLPEATSCNLRASCASNSLPEVTPVPEFGAKFTSNLISIHSEQLEGSGVGENPHLPTVHTYLHHSLIFSINFKTARGAKNEVAAQTSWKNSDLTHDIASMQNQQLYIHRYPASRLRPRSQLSANCDKPLALLPSLKVQQIA
ncbi:Hypothetical_protein [Hexamita inflata]|uniref:Hypothetical_protein n=1 Tax=Hexamita inflata TaxID=28002 RepID=A0AA86NRC8_9EUKA|nr:Hypothetical protein HINF_LOCUS11514 [Hexamita inflata]